MTESMSIGKSVFPTRYDSAVAWNDCSACGISVVR